MLFRDLKLRNIRSYVDETVVFSGGTTLLAGDIGSGKSTILLALEFALFGANKVELPAELLLRKGATQGSVELRFMIEGKEVVVQRGLKKERDSIKQTAGALIVNNVKKELMPVELKAEIIALLGYPEEFLTKNKNYIFRYTVYTPQEEMKQILQENSEERLDTLRKIFNLDRYEVIRENIQIYLRSLRTAIAIAKMKTEGLEGKKERIQQTKAEREDIEKKIQELSGSVALLRKEMQSTATRVEELEREQKLYQQQQAKLKTIVALIVAKEEQLRLSGVKLAEISMQVNALNLSIEGREMAEHTEQELKKKILLLESQRDALVQKNAQLHEKISTLQREILSRKEEVERVLQALQQLPEKEKVLQQLSLELGERPVLGQKREQLEDLFQKTGELIARNQALLEQSASIAERIEKMDMCPTCQQKVEEGHRHLIMQQEDNNKKQAEVLLFELKKKQLQIYQQREEVKAKIEALLRKENMLTRTRIEVEQLREKKIKIEQEHDTIARLSQQNNELLALLQQIREENRLTIVQNELASARESMNLLVKFRYLQQQKEGMQGEIQEWQLQLQQLQEERVAGEKGLQGRSDPSLFISTVKKEYTEITEREKAFLIELTEFQTKRKVSLQWEEEQQTEIALLTEERNRLVKMQELHHWLGDYFVQLTMAVERHVMGSIHQHFNSLFQEWFSILIDDEAVQCRVDDSFTPVIEQNGYEVSFSYLSGGEKTSAALAYRLALNRVINDVVHQIKTKDILILDEPTEGFSSDQLDKVREVLERLRLQQMIMVSHESKIESFVENVLRVHKEGHVSKIEAG